MSIKQGLRDVRKNFKLLSLYQQFEYVVILILTAFIAIIVVAAFVEPELEDFVWPCPVRQPRSI
jgi:hypothetical protein